jgi:hypothetical protein
MDSNCPAGYSQRDSWYANAMSRYALAIALLLGIGASSIGRASAAAPARGPTAASIIHRVAAVYGDAKPHVLKAQRTETDSTPQQTMYFVKLRGRFHKGSKRASYLQFSALVNRWYVWGIQAYNARHRLVWVDATLPRLHK